MTRLLLVDDEAAILFALGDYLETQGFRVSSARTRQAAEDLLADSRYDGVITDLSLEGRHNRDGFAILSVVRRDHPHTWAVLLTAFHSDEIAAEARTLGARAVIEKPVALSRLAQIATALADSATHNDEDLSR